MANWLGYTGKTAEAIAAHDKAVAALVHDYVAAHPGAGYAEVAAELGLSPASIPERQETP